MHVTFLGTGSAMASAERAQTGILLQEGDDALLVDCGAGVLHRLQQSGVGYEAVGHVLLTHHHLDHVSDLLPLMKARWLAGEESLTVAGPPGTEALVDGLVDVHEYMQDRIDLTVRDEPPGTFTVGGFDVEATQTRHSMQCHAYRFDGISEQGPVVGETESRWTFCFSGDSEAFAELAAFADGCEALAHDCSFPDGVDVSNHPTPSSLGRALAAADVDVGTVYLTHCYPHTDGNHDAMLDALGEQYDGDAAFAADLTSIELDG
jgi:ribonuclease BN (tRNA processing enzyme)